MTGNVVTKKYMSDNEKFADIFNYVLYDGDCVIKPEELTDCDSNEFIVSENKNGKIFVKDKMRDIKKNWVLKKDGQVAYLMLGVENQTDVHYAMPVRNMFYDVLEYERQLQESEKLHRKAGDLKGKEFISGFSKSDKLIPVITLVVYFGADKWDGPRTLHEMFDIEDEKILKYVSDYKLNLIEPAEIQDTDKFQSDFKYVVDFIKSSKDKKKLKKLVEENREYFSKVPNDTAMLIKICTDVDVKVKEEKEETNMCKAWEDMREDAREEGRQEMREEIERERRERQNMCKAWEDMREDAREEGRQEMREELEKERQKMQKERIEWENKKQDIQVTTSIEMIIRLNKKGLLSEENSATELKMSLEEYRECMRTYS